MDSFIAWIGGKRLLRDAIISRFPERFERYVEVFGGAGWVLFRKDQRGAEVFNDINGQLVNLFRCVKYHSDAVSREMEFLLNSRELFECFRHDAESMTDIQRAARYMFMIRASYGAKMGTFGARPRRLYDPDALRAVASRLARVVIERKSFEDLIPRYDSEGVLFYCDPPYVGAEGFYHVEFGEAEHTRLRDVLAAVKGRFILSYNDCEFARELYHGYRIDEITRQNNLASRRAGNKYRELIIRNY
jgi:DNA adenine methylase